MKPVLGMEGEKPTIITVAGMPERTNAKETKGSKRLLVGVIIGVVALAIVGTIVVLSVYFGAKITRDNFKEARQIFHIDDGKVIEEETKVTETEVAITIPNERQTVYDYKNGLVVDRFVDSETKVKTACYARYMNESEAPSNDAERYTDGEELSLNKKTESEQSENQKWASTTRQVPRYMISENVDKMCQDTDIFWMEKVQDDGISKRSLPCYGKDIGYTYICYPMSYKCSYYCFLDHYCMSISGTVYLYKKSNGWYCLDGCSPGWYNPVCP